MRLVFPFHLVPKFIQKPLVLRDYRITKQIVKDARDEISRYGKIIDEYDSKGLQLRSKEFYIASKKYYEQVLLEKQDRFEELSSQMRDLGMRLE